MKNLGKKMSTEAGTLVSYACSCWCYAPDCQCLNPSTNPTGSVDYAQKQSNNIQNNSKTLVIYM